jgi:hypothetical protein
MNSTAENVYTTSGETRVCVLPKLHKKPGRGCFPPFGGWFWLRDSEAWCRVRALFLGRFRRGRRAAKQLFFLPANRVPIRLDRS